MMLNLVVCSFDIPLQTRAKPIMLKLLIINCLSSVLSTNETNLELMKTTLLL